MSIPKLIQQERTILK